jgi:hypothetical protein
MTQEVMFNFADVAVLIVIAAGIAIGARRGFLKSLIKMFSSVISLVLTSAVTPLITGVVRKSIIYTMIFNNVFNKLALGDVTAATKSEQSSLIDALPVPEFIKNSLMENNNNVVYKILGADSIGEYIAHYIANIITEVIIFVLTFVIVFLIITLIMHLCRILCKIPVIKQCNAVGGGIIGCFSAVIVLWIAFAILNIFILRPGFVMIADTIKSSLIARVLYEHDVLIKLFFSPQ